MAKVINVSAEDSSPDLLDLVIAEALLQRQNDKEEATQEFREAQQDNCMRLAKIYRAIAAIDNELAQIGDLERRAAKQCEQRGRATRKNSLDTYKKRELRQRLLMQKRAQLKLEAQKYAIQQDAPMPNGGQKPTSDQ
jgi:succinate dehydrogenase/fumarate reductase flavoprotein subunit